MEACPSAAKVRKPLSDVTRRQVLRRTDKIWEAVTTVAAEENILVHQLLGLLLTRCGEQKITDIRAQDPQILKQFQNILISAYSVQQYNEPLASIIASF